MQKTFRKRIITQIGILTEDIQTAKTAWEKFLGLPSQQISQSDGYAQTHAVYRGEPLEGRIYQVCFNFENIELELIQPVGDVPSYWKECLEKNGPGIHQDVYKRQGQTSRTAVPGLLSYCSFRFFPLHNSIRPSSVQFPASTVTTSTSFSSMAFRLFLSAPVSVIKTSISDTSAYLVNDTLLILL